MQWSQYRWQRRRKTREHTAAHGPTATAGMRTSDDARNIYLPRLHSLPLHAQKQECHRGHWAHIILRPQYQAAPGKLAQVIRVAQCGWHESRCHPQQICPLPLLLLESCLQGLAKLPYAQCSIHLQLTFQPGVFMWLSRTMMGTDKLGEP